MSETFYVNGIDARTGTYRFPPMTLAQIGAMARAEPALPCTDQQDLEAWYDLVACGRGLVDGKDPKILAEAGWGVVFAEDDARAGEVKAALRELLDHRRAQVGDVNPGFYREFLGPDGFRRVEKNGRRRGETKREFLLRHGASPADAADPTNVPYYLLLVGDPQRIPYAFQYQLDVQYAVGRIWFDDLEDYERYAHQVVEAERARDREDQSQVLRAAFFGTRHDGDWLSELSADHLVQPLANLVMKDGPAWAVQTALGRDASKQRLLELLRGGENAPRLLFTASHGVVLDPGDPDLTDRQGALVCDEWEGPGCGKPLARDQYLSAKDLEGSQGLPGTVSFHFACHSAGTPDFSDAVPFSGERKERTKAADQPFVARLPQRLLTLGAQAVIGHVDFAWPWSIRWPGAGRRIQVFEDAVRRLLQGHPVGSAMELFGQRFATLSADLSDLLENDWYGDPSDDDLADVWTARNDARNYAVVGDPAVRVCDPKGT